MATGFVDAKKPQAVSLRHRKGLLNQCELCQPVASFLQEQSVPRVMHGTPMDTPFSCMTEKGQTGPVERSIMCHTGSFYHKPSLNGS